MTVSLSSISFKLFQNDFEPKTAIGCCLCCFRRYTSSLIVNQMARGQQSLTQVTIDLVSYVELKASKIEGM